MGICPYLGSRFGFVVSLGGDLQFSTPVVVGPSPLTPLPEGEGNYDSSPLPLGEGLGVRVPPTIGRIKL